MLFALGVFGILFLVCGGIYGGGVILWRFVDGLDLGTKKGMLTYLLLIVPAMAVSIIAGPFVTLWMAIQGFRKMPWK